MKTIKCNASEYMALLKIKPMMEESLANLNQDELEAIKITIKVGNWLSKGVDTHRHITSIIHKDNSKDDIKTIIEYK